MILYHTRTKKTYSTGVFQGWLASLRDKVAYRAVLSRVSRLGFGLLGDFKPVGNGVYELRIDHGPGYRVYYCRKGDYLVILCGGDKRT
ncbi:MAG: hypothetical protein LBF50_05100, partial [Azoarcus sp.]|nr:hypothetical protein [Azoarcus sp.]